MNKKILITGSNGQLGREIQRVLPAAIFTDVLELDITDIAALRKATKDIDIIINCAAYTNVDKAEDEKELADLLNNQAVENLAIVTKENNASLIHISTDYVFDGYAYRPYTEEQETKPIGIYGATKLAGEESIINSGCNYIIIRTSWLYSIWGNNFVKTMKELTNERDTLNVIFDQIGTPTYAGDLADAIAKIILNDELDKQGIYHFSNEGICSWYDFAIEIAALCGNDCEIKPIHSYEYPSKVSRPYYSVLDKTKIKEVFNLKIPHWKASLIKCIGKLQ